MKTHNSGLICYLSIPMRVLCLTGLLGTSPLSADDKQVLGVYALDLKQLLNIQFNSSASLTTDEPYLSPAVISVISKEQIRNTNARSLFELLEIHINGLQVINHHYEGRHMAIRGLLSDRNDKYLLLVNGKVMNEKTHYGALSERDLPFFSDIEKIELVRGAGSVIHGPGAVAMVINIITKSVNRIEENRITVSAGIKEEFAQADALLTLEMGEAKGYLSAGVSKYPGADHNTSPFVPGLTSDSNVRGIKLEAGKPASLGVPDNNANHLDNLRYKLHGQIQWKNMDAWMRYTTGGENMVSPTNILRLRPYGDAEGYAHIDDIKIASIGYEQITLATKYTQHLSPKTMIQYKLEFDRTDYERLDTYSDNDTPPVSHGEQEILLTVSARHQLTERQVLAVVGESSNNRFGLKSIGWPDLPANMFTFRERSEPTEQWSSARQSLVLEHKWNIANPVTLFSGIRWDKHDFVKSLYSPRLALVYAQSNQLSHKLILSNSVRHALEEELKIIYNQGDQADTIETVNSLEYGLFSNLDNSEKSLARQINFSTFVNKLDAVSFSSGGLRNVGELTIGGLEIEAVEARQNFSFRVGYSYTDLFKIESVDDTGEAYGNAMCGKYVVQALTAAPCDYGYNLANWAKHSLKLSGHWQINDKLSLSGALRAYWNWQGAEDMAKYSNEVPESERTWVNAPNFYDETYDDFASPSHFLNFGVHYRYKNIRTSFNGYNLLGLLNIRHNKRNYLYSVVNYRAEAPAYSVTLGYDF